ncbi:unnamed protein product, partial [Prorocentrum cordatum]
FRSHFGSRLGTRPAFQHACRPGPAMSAPAAAPVPAVEHAGAPDGDAAWPVPSGSSAAALGDGLSKGSTDPQSPTASAALARRPSILREAADEMLVELRGAPLQSCFSGRGRIWRSSAGEHSHYERTQKRDRLDWFISHDWGTSRWMKLLTLAVYFNGVSALCASFATCMLVFALQVAGVLAQRKKPEPCLTAGVEYEEVHGVWCFPAGVCAFFFVLLYWQVCRERVLPPAYAFVDKMCINQRDPREKERGVYSIGGFLQKSDFMLMLCTHRYFSRMWCTFEVAAWLRFKGVGSIVFLPPSDAVFTGVFFSIVLLTHFGVYVGTHFPGVPISACAKLIALCAPLPLVHSLRLVMRDLLSMPELLRTHDVAQTQCFCCQHKHVDPETGSALMCDREKVYDAIDCWYGSGAPRSSLEIFEAAGPSCTAAASRDGTARFNEDVQTKLAEALEVMVAQPVSYTSCLIAASPSMWYFLDQVTAIVLDGPYDAYLTFKRFLRILIISFILWPLVRANTVAMAKRFRHRGAGRCGELGRSFAAFGSGYLPIYACYWVLVSVASPSESMAIEVVLVVLLVVRIASLRYPLWFRLMASPKAELDVLG